MSPARPNVDVDPIRSLNWSLLKDFLVIAQAGSLSAAARRLGVSQSTLTRRMDSLEESLHAELFRRSPRGLELTESGEAMIEPARQMEQGAQAAELAVTGRDLSPAGLVRITATDGLAVEWLTPALAGFRIRHPRIDFELITRTSSMDLLRREADIAIRLGRPQQSELVARRMGELLIALYASRAYLARRGTPRTPADLADHDAIAFDEGDLYTGSGGVLNRLLGDSHVAYRGNTLVAQLAAVRAGFGIGAQACFIARRDPELVRVLPASTLRLEVWLVTHPGLRRSARIRAVYDFLADELTAAHDLFGRDPDLD